MIASSVLMHLMKVDAGTSIDGQLPSANVEIDQTFHVTIGRGQCERHEYHEKGCSMKPVISRSNGLCAFVCHGRFLTGKNPEAYSVDIDSSSDEKGTLVHITDSTGNKRAIKISDIDWQLGSPLFKASIDGAPRVVQSLASTVTG